MRAVVDVGAGSVVSVVVCMVVVGVVVMVAIMVEVIFTMGSVVAVEVSTAAWALWAAKAAEGS